MLLCLTRVSSAFALTHITAATLDTSDNKTRIILTFNQKPRYTAFILEHPNRAVIDIHAVQLRTRLPASNGNASSVLRLRSGKRPSQGLRIVADLKTPVRLNSTNGNTGSSWKLIVELTPLGQSKNALPITSNEEEPLIEIPSRPENNISPSKKMPISVPPEENIPSETSNLDQNNEEAQSIPSPSKTKATAKNSAADNTEDDIEIAFQKAAGLLPQKTEKAASTKIAETTPVSSESNRETKTIAPTAIASAKNKMPHSETTFRPPSSRQRLSENNASPISDSSQSAAKRMPNREMEHTNPYVNSETSMQQNRRLKNEGSIKSSETQEDSSLVSSSKNTTKIKPTSQEADTIQTPTAKPSATTPVSPPIEESENILHQEIFPSRDKKLPSRYLAKRDVIIVIDAGHGGKDPGAVNPNGTREKDVTLAIAQRLQRLLHEEPGIRAILTRSDDTFIGLRNRLNIARKHKADVFVSIHADAFKTPEAYGSSVFALSPGGASSEAARWLAEKENTSELGDVNLEDKGAALRSVLLDLSQTATISLSVQLGSHVLSQLGHITHVRHAAVEQARFMVLKSPDIPSILVETGFISNAEEAKRLRDPIHQARIATALKTGLRRHFIKYPPPGTMLAVQHNKSMKHIVGNGETLAQVAKRYEITPEALRQHNQLKSYRVSSGQVLYIPTG